MRVILHNFEQSLVALDQLLNVIVCMLTLQPGYADETLSAHAHRAKIAGKVFGKFFVPVIDFLFIWQEPDAATAKYVGRYVTSHCERSYINERLRRGLPPEYR